MLPIASRRHYCVITALVILLSGLFAWLQQPIEIVVMNRLTHQILAPVQINIRPELQRISEVEQRFQAIWFILPATVTVQAPGYQKVQTKLLLMPGGEYTVELEPFMH